MYYIYGTIVGKNDETEEASDDFFFFFNMGQKEMVGQKKKIDFNDTARQASGAQTFSSVLNFYQRLILKIYKNLYNGEAGSIGPIKALQMSDFLLNTGDLDRQQCDSWDQGRSFTWNEI